MNCLSGSSSDDEYPSHITVDDIVKELLSYFSGFRDFKKAKADIEIRCDIKKKSIWSVKDIKQAWRKTENMRKKSNTRKHWSRVIVLQELKRRMYNEEAEPDLKENEDTQACGPAQRKENTDSRSFVSNTELKMVGDASQPAERWQNKLIIKEQSGQNFGQQHLYIQIPLSDMSEKNNTHDSPNQIESPDTPYKLMNGYPSVKEIRKGKSYVMSYNNETKNADWVYEILNKSTLADNCPELKLKSKKYHKGHLAAAANHKWCLEAKNDASMVINLAPQQKDLNRRTWASLENYCRQKTGDSTVRNVHVYTGPLYSYPRKWVSVKEVPSHFFKVIIVEKDNGTVEEPKCYLFPNEAPKFNLYELYYLNIQHFQQQSGLTFICSYPGVTQDRIKTITWQGKNEDGQLCTAKVNVRISNI